MMPKLVVPSFVHSSSSHVGHHSFHSLHHLICFLHHLFLLNRAYPLIIFCCTFIISIIICIMSVPSFHAHHLTHFWTHLHHTLPCICCPPCIIPDRAFASWTLHLHLRSAGMGLSPSAVVERLFQHIWAW